MLWGLHLAALLSAVSQFGVVLAGRDNWGKKTFDIQGHRGGRGDAVENILPSFAWGLIHGSKTLEIDIGISKDSELIVWHDEFISSTKCQDTAPAFENDPNFPYVGQYIANLTLAQLKTLDCGSKRLLDFPLALTYPGTKLSTLPELFDFADCADPKHDIHWNVEAKVNPVSPNLTRSVEDFVNLEHAIFASSPYYQSIIFQAFDWRVPKAMKEKDPSITTSALISNGTYTGENGTTSPWLAGLRVDSFPGATVGEQIVEAAASINMDIVSSSDTASGGVPDPTQDGYIPFTTKAMVDRAHQLGLQIKAWTTNRLSVAERLLEIGVDGIITDYPLQVRRLLQTKGIPVPPTYSEKKVLKCLERHIQTV